MQKYGEIARNVYYGDCALGEWVAHQKRAYKAGTLSEDRIALLLAANPHFFERWNSSAQPGSSSIRGKKDNIWNYKFSLYKELVAINNRITKNTIYKNERIGEWIRTQKRAEKLGKMPEDRKQKLLEVDQHFFDRKRRES